MIAAKWMEFEVLISWRLDVYGSPCVTALAFTLDPATPHPQQRRSIVVSFAPDSDAET
jgi:hypothetical protein